MIHDATSLILIIGRSISIFYAVLLLAVTVFKASVLWKERTLFQSPLILTLLGDQLAYALL